MSVASSADKYEDMAIEAGSTSPEDEETALNEAIKAASLPTIHLSFDNRKGGAWDDRELVNAYDAAMEEFHAHHPGPGSWLDKATAALAKGQPLPGADDHGSPWYSASFTTSALQAHTVKAAAPPAAPTSAPTKRPRKSGPDINGHAFNPYVSRPSTSTALAVDRRASPSYVPPSPPVDEGSTPWEYPEDHAQAEEYDTYDQQIHDAQPIQQQAPTYGVQTVGGVSSDDVMTYAMTAQYWAGYWMGVAQTRTQGQGSEMRPLDADRTPNNVIRSRQHYDRALVGGLKR